MDIDCVLLMKIACMYVWWIDWYVVGWRWMSMSIGKKIALKLNFIRIGNFVSNLIKEKEDYLFMQYADESVLYVWDTG